MSEPTSPSEGATPVRSEPGDPLARAYSVSALNIAICLLSGVLVAWLPQHWKDAEFPCDLGAFLVWFLPLAPAPVVLGLAAAGAYFGLNAISQCRAAGRKAGKIVSVVGLLVLGKESAHTSSEQGCSSP